MKKITCIEMAACRVKPGDILVSHGKTNKTITSVLFLMPKGEQITLRFLGGEVVYSALQIVLIQKI
jgi:hypothetical protein